MKQTKHTPGPWHIIETASTRNKGQSDYLLANKSPFCHGVMTGPMSDADLSLIQTAPDLLECLEHMVQVLRSINSTTHDIARTVDYAKNVIRKAKGE